MQSRASRVVRGTLVAAVSLAVAVFSHVLAGGGAPGAVGFALAGAFAVLVSTALTGKKFALPRLAVSVAASQFVLHTLFSLGTGSAASFSEPAHHGAVQLVSHGASSAAAHHDPGSMWFAHSIAGLLTIVWLWRVEASLWSTIAKATERILHVFAPRGHVAPVLVGVRRVFSRISERIALRDDVGLALSPMRYRGPPDAVTA